MKKLLILFTAAVTGLLAVSCNFEDVYTITNLNDIVTVKGEYLISDIGTSYRVTDDQTGSKDWQKEDNRLHVIMDVLNRQLEVSLKKANIMEIREPEALTVTDEDPKDPVVVALQSISGSYLNLVLQIYEEKGTECPHDISFQYRKDPDSEDMELFVFHYGNNENPSRIPEDDLKTELRFYSIPLGKLTTSTSARITLTMDVLVKDTDGKYSVKRTSYQMNQSSYYSY